MPRPTVDVNGPGYQEILQKRAMHRRYGPHAKDMIWADETMARLEKKVPYGDYTGKDRAEFERVQGIYARVLLKTESNPEETAENHTTHYYIWRTQGDDKVRSSHSRNDGLVFSWDSPPLTGHPGEGFNCRCRAEPYTPPRNMREKSHQILLTQAEQDKTPAWTNDDFFNHYETGNGKGVSLSEIGYLHTIIDSARTKVFPEVEEQIHAKARRLGEGAYPYKYRDSYKFHLAVFAIGGATVSREGQMTVVKQGDFLIVKANVDYHFYDKFTDPYDLINITDGEYNPTGTKPYDIEGNWSTYIDAIIRKDSQQSRFPTP